jgi:peptidoglycan/xylan/chitin deacetylase (PgdA/CDA1 family)
MERASDSAAPAPMYESKPASVTAYLSLKIALYRLCKWIGLFRIARRATRHGLRILCYHGFSMADESEFSPRTFMKPATFEKRMRFLKKKGFPVLGLGDALAAIDAGILPPNAVAITIDDGFYGVYRCAWPILRKLSLPATVYVTTYYALKKNPIFRIVVQYMFWKTRVRSLSLADLGLPGMESVSIAESADKDRVLLAVIRHGETSCDEEGRQRIAARLGERLGVDYRTIAESRILSIMTVDEIAELSRGGIDIELHSHRHDLPLERAAAEREIGENRAVLDPLAGGARRHFCYPSGFFRREQLPWLSDFGIESAVTCIRGLNYSDTPKLELMRFIDGEDVSFIEYEAEIEGFSELLRRVLAGPKALVGKGG